MRQRRRQQRIKRLALAGTALILATASFTAFAVTRPGKAPERETAPQLMPEEAAPSSDASGTGIRETEKAERTQQEAEQAEAKTEQERQYIASMDWDAEDGYLLAKIAMAEAEGEDTEGKALVILTVLNRVWAPQFPGTIEGVITQPNAFASYWDGRWERVEPDADCYAALRKVQVEHWDESQGALYFERSTTEDTWHSRNLKKLFTHGNHTFYTEETP